MNNNTTKNVTFNFDDKGSLRKLSANYDAFMKTASQSAQLYSQNTSGNPVVQQQKYLQQELQYLKQIRDENKKIFEEKKRQLTDLLTKEESISERLKSGKLSQGAAQEDLEGIARERRKILSGTGYRHDYTFFEGGQKALTNQDLLISKIEKSLNESTNILRNILSHDKDTAIKQIDAIENSDKSTHEEIIAAQQARSILTGREKEEKDKSADKKSSVVHDILTAQNLISGLSNIKQIATASSPIDAARSAVGAVSSTINAIGDAFGPIGTAISRIFTTAGEIAFEQSMQTLQQRDSLLQGMYANRALMGGSLINPIRTDQFGISYTDFVNTLSPLARSRGSASGVRDIGYSSLQLQKGFGVEQSALQQLLEVTRSSAETDKNIENLIGGIWEQGQGIFQNDRTFLNEFLSQYTSLHKNLLQTQSSVSSGSVFSTLNTFNRLGGQFDLKHPAAAGLINSINQSLTKPSGDVMDAMTFMALRGEMPEASMLDILIAREQGFNNPKYFKSFMNMIGGMGGGELHKTKSVADAFGINLEAARTLVSGIGTYDSMTDEEIKGKIAGLDKMAEDNTTALQKENAKFVNNIIEGMNFEAAVEGIKGVLREVFEGQSFTFNVTTGELTQSFTKVNNTKKPTASPVNTALSGRSVTSQAISYGGFIR